MFSFFRAIEALSIRRQERCVARNSVRKRLGAISNTFGVPIEEIINFFSTPTDALNLCYPIIEHLHDLGLEAFLVVMHVEINDFPRCISLIRRGRLEIKNHHYEIEGRHTFLSQSDEFCGKNIHLLTDDIDLIKVLADAKFGPPPPWISWYELGPAGVLARQGGAEYWYDFVWDGFWNSLCIEEQAKYLADWRVQTKSYMSDEEWEDWVSFMELRDPRRQETAGK